MLEVSFCENSCDFLIINIYNNSSLLNSDDISLCSVNLYMPICQEVGAFAIEVISTKVFKPQICKNPVHLHTNILSKTLKYAVCNGLW